MPKIFHLIINPAALEFYADIKKYITELKSFQYLKCCEHIGQDQQHYHMFVQFNVPINKLSIRKLHGAHVIPKDDKKYPYGSSSAILKYVMAEDDEHKAKGVTAVLIDEIGEYKPQGGDHSIKHLLEIDNVEDLPDYRMYNTWKRLKSTRPMKARQRCKNVKVYYIQGPSGIGKTNKAIDLAEEFENMHDTYTDWIKYENGFYSGITGQAKVAIYDDFRSSDMKAKEFVNLIDYNRHNMNIKNGHELNNYNLIIITSVQPLSKIYKNIENDEPRRQWERRVEVINMFPPEPVTLGGLSLGYRTDFNELERYTPTRTLTEVEVTDNWGDHVIIN